MRGVVVTVSDTMQKTYRYVRTEPAGKNFDSRFRPQLTPKQMLAMGVFGGVYLRDCRKEFPKDWFMGARLQKQGVRTPDAKLNYFEIHASQSLAVWRAKGWIHKDDPRGWFQWYCRYYSGRRGVDDERQIKRWIAIRRHIAQIQAHCLPGDLHCRRRQRQAVLHWAYDSRRA